MPDTAQDDSNLDTNKNNPDNPGLYKQTVVDSARMLAQSKYERGDKGFVSNMQKDSDASSSPNHRLSVTKTAPGSVVPKLHPAAVAAGIKPSQAVTTGGT